MQNLNKNAKKDFSNDFKDFHTLVFMHFHSFDECSLSEFLKIYLSGVPCVMLIRNNENIIEDNGKILQEKEFILLGRKFNFKYCCYYTQTLKDLNLPTTYFLYNKNETNIGVVMWYNGDYFFYLIRYFFPQFKYYFEIQNDCFLNGDYKDFLALYRNDETDLFLTNFEKEYCGIGWYGSIDVDWIYEKRGWYGYLGAGRRISGQAIEKLYLKRLEYSQIYSQLDTNKIKARWLYLEIFVPTEAVRMGFSVKPLMNSKMQFRPEIDLNNTRLFVFPDNYIYHPVKGNFLQRLNDQDKYFNAEISNLNNEIQELKTLPVLKQKQELANLKLETQEKEQNIKIKKLEVKKLEKDLGLKLSKLEPRVNLVLNENLKTSAVARVRNHLAYKLGATLIIGSKSFFTLVSLPFVLSFIKAQYKKEQSAYQSLIKQKPELKFPAIETYPDYQAALKEKECFTYKLGEAFLKACKIWYKGGFFKFYFEVKRLYKEFKKKQGLKSEKLI